MSGIYIKNMEMPKYCWECHFGNGETGICLVDFKPHGDWNEPENCPLVPVPDHGDLIDRVAFRREMDKHYPFDKYTQRKHGEEDAAKGTVMMMLANAPTIIPAEEEVGE